MKKQINEKIFIELYRTGKTDIELSQIFECSERTIQRFSARLRAQGKIKLRSRLNPSKKEKTKFKFDEIFEEVQVYIDNARAVLEEEHKHYKNIKLETKIKKTSKSQSEDMVQLWSDMHTGMINHNPLSGEVTYNEEIQKEEYNTFLRGINRFQQLYKPAYNIQNLYILDLGDNITNDRIFEGQQMEITCGYGEQILKCVEMQSHFIREMLRKFPKVIFIGVSGNHGRSTKKYLSEDATNNFEFLKNTILQERFAGNPRVEIIVPKTYLYTLNLRGHKYLISHGNNIRGTTLNSIEKANKELANLATENDYDLMIMGHFHTSLKLPIKPKTTLLVNGCWIDVDDFAYTKLRKYSTPAQYNFLVSNKSSFHNLQEINLKWKNEDRSK